MDSVIIRHDKDVLSALGMFGGDFVNELVRLVGNSAKANLLFNKLNRFQLEVDLFFLPELYELITVILAKKRRFTKVNTEALNAILRYIDEKIWKTKENSVDAKQDPYDYSIVQKKFNVKMLDHQDKAIREYKSISTGMNYRGMLLFGHAGTGKTLLGLFLSELLLSDKIIIVCPLQTIDRVWINTIEERYKVKQNYFLVNGNKPYTNERFIICSYENIGKLLEAEVLLSNKRTTLIVDESHNFADPKSNRTDGLLKLVNKLDSENNILMSGTPIKSGFRELAIILSILDRRFKGKIVNKFLTIYRSPTDTMEKVLQNRFSTHTARMEKEALRLDPVITEYIPIKLKNGNEYTLPAIVKKLKAYVAERSLYYQKLKPNFEETYTKLYNKAKHLLRNTIKPKEFEEYEKEFKMVIRYFEQGVLMYYPDLVKRVNVFEDKTIIPVLDKDEKVLFREAKTVIKYAVLKIQGEALANVVMKSRIEAHRDMAAVLDYNKLLTSTTKKTIIFSNYKEVCDAALTKVTKLRYKPITVYGETTKNLTQHVGIFVNKPNINPLVTTFKSLSTGVPLIVANVIIVLDLPFRMYIYEQAIARAWRLGQNKQVYVYIPKLDTGDTPNINSRNIDIIQFFKQEVENITGQKMSISLDETLDISNEMFNDPIDFGYIDQNLTISKEGVLERW